MAKETKETDPGRQQTVKLCEQLERENIAHVEERHKTLSHEHTEAAEDTLLHADRLAAAGMPKWSWLFIFCANELARTRMRITASGDDWRGGILGVASSLLDGLRRLVDAGKRVFDSDGIMRVETKTFESIAELEGQRVPRHQILGIHGLASLAELAAVSKEQRERPGEEQVEVWPTVDWPRRMPHVAALQEAADEIKQQRGPVARPCR